MKNSSNNSFLVIDPKTHQISENSEVGDSTKRQYVEASLYSQTIIQPNDFESINNNNDMIIVESFEKEQQQLQYKKPYEYMAFEGLEDNENGNNFSIISAGLLQIMCDMLNTVTSPLSQSSESLQSTEFIKPGIFIMLTMDKNEKKRLYSYKLFLILVDRNINISNSREKEYLIYAMCNQLYQFYQNDEKFFEYTISIIINQIFNFASDSIHLEIDHNYLKPLIGNIVSRLIYVNLLISLIYTARKNLKLLHKCLHFLILLFDFHEISSRIDQILNKSSLLQILLNLLHYFTVEYIASESEPQSLPQYESTIINSNDIVNDLKELFCLIVRSLFKQPDSIDNVQKIENYSYIFSLFINYTYESVNIGNTWKLLNSPFFSKLEFL